MLKNVYFRLGLISAIATVALLVALPRIPIKFDSRFGNVDSRIGGYYINLFNGRFILDLRNLKRGLDLDGGVRIVLKANMDNIAETDREAALESAREVISRRVNLLGVTEPVITTSKIGEEYRIIVEIPGLDDVASAVNLIGQTAQLQFKQLKSDQEWSEDKFQEYYTNPDVWEDTQVTGADLRGVDVVFPQGKTLNSNAPQIQLRFTDEGRSKFSDLAKNNVGKPIALFLSESSYPLSMPVVSEDLAQGVVDDPVISGNFDVQTANALSLQIRAGALPVPVEVLEQKTIGATLGEESVHKSLFAGSIGLILVMLFMIFHYGKLGFMADAALVIYTIIVISIFKLVPIVLTLPGVAGFILSIGMAADANILIFERVKEEIIWGRPHGVAIRLGFERAWTSIRDSNITSLITASILFYFGTGPVRGFALTLSIGILVSLFTSIFVTRTFIKIFNFNVEGDETPGRKSFWSKLGFLNRFFKGKYADN